MFARFMQRIAARPPPDDPLGFVEEIRVVHLSRGRGPRVEKLLLCCWLAIAAKCALVVWLVGKYQMAFSPLWVNAPTVFFGLTCTVLCFRRD